MKKYLLSILLGISFVFIFNSQTLAFNASNIIFSGNNTINFSIDNYVTCTSYIDKFEITSIDNSTLYYSEPNMYMETPFDLIWGTNSLIFHNYITDGGSYYLKFYCDGGNVENSQVLLYSDFINVPTQGNGLISADLAVLGATTDTISSFQNVMLENLTMVIFLGASLLISLAVVYWVIKYFKRVANLGDLENEWGVGHGFYKDQFGNKHLTPWQRHRANKWIDDRGY